MEPLNEFRDLIDSREIMARLDELTATRAPWVAGWNMPGYMPDSDPIGCETWAEARDVLAEEMEREADRAAEAEDQPALDKAEARKADAMAAAENEGFTLTLGAYVFWVEAAENDGFDSPEDKAEFDSLTALAAEAADYCPDWDHGATMVRDSYTRTYAEEFADDIGALGNEAQGWPLYCIDWERAARELFQNWTAVEFNGVRYWVQS